MALCWWTVATITKTCFCIATGKKWVHAFHVTENPTPPWSSVYPQSNLKTRSLSSHRRSNTTQLRSTVRIILFLASPLSLSAHFPVSAMMVPTVSISVSMNSEELFCFCKAYYAELLMNFFRMIFFFYVWQSNLLRYLHSKGFLDISLCVYIVFGAVLKLCLYINRLLIVVFEEFIKVNFVCDRWLFYLEFLKC